MAARLFADKAPDATGFVVGFATGLVCVVAGGVTGLVGVGLTSGFCVGAGCGLVTGVCGVVGWFCVFCCC